MRTYLSLTRVSCGFPISNCANGNQHKKTPSLYMFLPTNKNVSTNRTTVFTSLVIGRPGCARPRSTAGHLQPDDRPVETHTHSMSHCVCFSVMVPVSVYTHHVSCSSFDHRLDVDAQLLLTSTLRTQRERERERRVINQWPNRKDFTQTYKTK